MKMTDEIKTCDCKEKCVKKVKEFSFIAGAVFVGATLAILLSASILRPKQPPMPPQMMQPPIRMERTAPQFHHGRPEARGEFRGPEANGQRGIEARGPEGQVPQKIGEHKRPHQDANRPQPQNQAPVADKK
jgi:hypothetical protein